MKRTFTMEDGRICTMAGDPDKSISERGGCRFGGGGQGTVYKVTYEGKSYALKIYHRDFSTNPTAFANNLKANIAKGAPSPSFLWPKLFLPQTADNMFGYMMELRAPEYASFVDVVRGKNGKGQRVGFASKEMQIYALIDLVKAFMQLHAKGYSYQDLNDGGVFFDVKNGKALICDNDNVSPYGVNLGIRGMFKYMAPEIAIKMFVPDVHSDRYSLAVLLFWVLMGGHPLDGQRMLTAGLPEALAAQIIYGSEPVFVFHPTDTSNRPDPALQKRVLTNWARTPKFIQELFIKTFTNGMPYKGQKRSELERTRQKRVTDKDWLNGLYRWLNTMTDCPKCGYPVIQDVGEDGVLPVATCSHCNGATNRKLPVLVVKKENYVVSKIVLQDKKVVTMDMLLSGAGDKKPVFTVTKLPQADDFYGLVNESGVNWQISQNGTVGKPIAVGAKAPCLPGVEITFAYGVTGEVKVGY